MTLDEILRESASRHRHLCPRQVLGARIGLAGMDALGFDAPPARKQMLIISETDGCFVDGVIAATNCAVGRRTLRVEDYGKVAAAFVDLQSGRTLRIAPLPGIRDRAFDYAQAGTRRYFAQMAAYQTMPVDELLSIREVALATPVEAIVSRPGVRVNCDVCGEEIMNEREIRRDGLTLCRACAGDGYYFSTVTSLTVNSVL